MSVRQKDSNGNWVVVAGNWSNSSGGGSASDEMVGMVEQNTLCTMFKLINEQGLTTDGMSDNVVYIGSEDTDKYEIYFGAYDSSTSTLYA